ncbi:MAG: protein phosphatase 2C family protein [Acidimicrobiaceae bacterium]|nr:protein phosphatase 2C family protein [Acidimicrobiaceae bacterium]
MIGGVTGSEAVDSREAQPEASVATASDIGPRRVNEDRALAVISESDGSWVIAVADGLGGHTRGDEAAQAAVEGLPHRIASADEMAVTFGEANERVLALTGPETWQKNLPMFMFPMSTLCVAAWTPEGGLLIGWMGDTLPFIATAQADGFSGFLCGRPHRVPGGSIEICLGMPPADAEPGPVEVEIIGESGDGTRPDAVILASDGAWEPFIYEHGVEWFSDDSAGGGIGAACGAGAESAEEVANNILAGAVGLGLDDNATIAVALWR